MVHLSQMTHQPEPDRHGALMIALAALHCTCLQAVRRLDAVVAEFEKKADRNEKAA